MSGDTVTGRALQFTNDNKHAYAYSGKIAVQTTRTTLLDFDTNSSYIVAELQPTYFTTSTSVDFFMEILIDNVLVYNVEIITSQLTNPYQEIEIIIPPNSNFLVQCYTAGGARDIGCILTGKVGMAQRVGNLDD